MYMNDHAPLLYRACENGRLVPGALKIMTRDPHIDNIYVYLHHLVANTLWRLLYLVSPLYISLFGFISEPLNPGGGVDLVIWHKLLLLSSNSSSKSLVR